MPSHRGVRKYSRSCSTDNRHQQASQEAGPSPLRFRTHGRCAVVNDPSTPKQQPSKTEVNSNREQNTGLHLPPLPTFIGLMVAPRDHPCSPGRGTLPLNKGDHAADPRNPEKLLSLGGDVSFLWGIVGIDDRRRAAKQPVPAIVDAYDRVTTVFFTKGEVAPAFSAASPLRS